MSDSPKSDPTVVRPVVESVASPLRPPAIVGAFAMERLLGRGGMASVWQARDRRSGRAVAVKLMDPSLAADPSLVERFLREAKNCSALRHRNVLEVLAYGESAGWYYIASELVEAGTVTALLAKIGPMPFVLAAELTAQMLDGLQSAHSAGLVHRDLKPDNLLLTPSGVLKVADFGIARALDTEKLTRTGMVIGTAAYMSPEQAKGEDVDARSDLFSAGIVFFELLTGVNPFRVDGAASTIARILSAAPPRLGAARRSTPAALEAVLDRLLAPERQGRWSSAREALDALLPFLAVPRARHPQLVAQCLAAPEQTKVTLDQDAASVLVAEAQTALREEGALSLNRAALKLAQALDLAPGHPQAKQAWDSLSQRLPLSLGPSQNPKLLELEQRALADPSQPALFTQMAQLHKLEGNLLSAAVALKHYLRLKPGDAYVATQLFQLTGETLAPAQGAGTAELVKGIRTGGFKAQSNARTQLTGQRPQVAAPVPAGALPELTPVSPMKAQLKKLATVGTVVAVLGGSVWWLARKIDQWSKETAAIGDKMRAEAPVLVAPQADPAEDLAQRERKAAASAAQRLDEAARLEKDGDPEGALATYRRLHDDFPKREEGRRALFRSGLVLLGQSRNSEARGAFEQYLEKYPAGADAAEALLRRGEAAAKNLDDATALTDFDRFVTEHGSSAYVNEAWVLRGELKARKGDTAGAQADFKEVLARVDAKSALYARAEEGLKALPVPPAP